MPDELRIGASLLLSIVACAACVPVAIRVARRTEFLDVPIGYKGHARSTPYLGGCAVIAAFVLTALLLGEGATRYAAIVVCAIGLFVVGTIDDRVGLGPWIRLVIEAAAAGALWKAGLGWSLFGDETANLLLTVVWVVGLVNAFNLMDNMDGAAATVAATASCGIALLALHGGDAALAGLAIAIGGACAGFLPFNLARPSRIFLGDGGSMPVGFVIAACAMLLPHSSALGWASLLAVVPVVGLPILDTTLVVVSRRRRGVRVLSGARDHLTHRLRAQLGTARMVSAALAVGQAALCVAALGLIDSERGAVIAAAGLYTLAAVVAIYVLELPWRADRSLARVGAGGPVTMPVSVAGSPPAPVVLREE